MLKLYLHFATPERLSSRNCVGRLDIGYEKAYERKGDQTKYFEEADFKVAMHTHGEGEHPQIVLKDYPRWTVEGVWDLATRAICLSLHQSEEIWPPQVPRGRKGAFIEDLTAVVEEWPDGDRTGRTHVGTAHISMCKTECNYRAWFCNGISAAAWSSVFAHGPSKLNFWELLTRGYGWWRHEKFCLPKRSELYVPIPFIVNGESLVSLDTVSGPARTGIIRWLAKRGQEARRNEVTTGLCVTKEDFTRFLLGAP